MMLAGGFLIDVGFGESTLGKLGQGEPTTQAASDLLPLTEFEWPSVHLHRVPRITDSRDKAGPGWVWRSCLRGLQVESYILGEQTNNRVTPKIKSRGRVT